MGNFPPHCYYCDSKDFGSVDEYERHVVVHHPDLPGPADFQLFGLKKQGMSWEREIKADFEWK